MVEERQTFCEFNDHRRGAMGDFDDVFKPLLGVIFVLAKWESLLKTKTPLDF